MKVVINKCFGGFGISIEALKELLIMDAKCIKKHTPKEYYGGRNGWEKTWKDDLKTDYSNIGEGMMAHKSAYNIYKDGILYSLNDRSEPSLRSDVDLIKIVEELGDKANGICAKLSVIEIPDGIDFEIDEYDGFEHIAEKHRTWW